MHMKRHTKPYECLVPGCSWRFYQDRDLRKHRKTHLAEASFRCFVEGCLSSATRHYNMVRHLRSKHGIKVKQGEIARHCPRS
jgi:hypothetical protein